MPAGKKARTGCARCKEKRLKCDESRPACQRCTRSKKPCPGYTLSLRWSTKHEILKPERSRGDTSHHYRIDSLLEDTIFQGSCDDGLTTETHLYLIDTEANLPVVSDSDAPDRLIHSSRALLQDCLPTTKLPTANAMRDDLDGLEIQDDQFPDIWDLNQDVLEPPLLEPAQFEHMGLGLEQDQGSVSQWTDFCYDFPELVGSCTSTAVNRRATSLCPVITRDEDVLIGYYFKEVAVIYSCYDGAMNPFRSIVASLSTSSELMLKTLKSMAAACLAPEYPHLSREGFRLRKEILTELEKPSNIYDPVDVTLLITIMLGQTTGWHNPKDLGFIYYQRSKALLTLLESGKPNKCGTVLGRNTPFFRIAIEYWEMLFAFVAGRQELPLSVTYPQRDRLSLSLIEPHPWALVAPGILQTIRQVGELVWENRTASRRRQFWQRSDLNNIEVAITHASELEKQLLDYNFPLEDNVIDPLDATTPVAHLVTICQAYRLVALIQIYRVFPDILTARAQSQERLNALTDCALHRASEPHLVAGQDRQACLRELAMHALELVKSIPLESHTRCIQPFLLIALASETGSIATDSFNASMLSTVQARRFIRGRLESFRLLLPPKPAQCRLDLVLQIWDNIDNDRENVYWLDVVIEKDWQFLFG